MDINNEEEVEAWKKDLITNSFLENNCFSKDNIVCGSNPWRYEEKKFGVVISLWGDGGGARFIHVYNNDIGKRMTIEYTDIFKPLKSDLQKLLNLCEIEIDFDYNQ